jgi:hypothetical protein
MKPWPLYPWTTPWDVHNITLSFSISGTYLGLVLGQPFINQLGLSFATSPPAAVGWLSFSTASADLNTPGHPLLILQELSCWDLRIIAIFALEIRSFYKHIDINNRMIKKYAKYLKDGHR